nr:reverse transcriptase domain-containing protein [Tanacetum cinerariifolium]
MNQRRRRRNRRVPYDQRNNPPQHPRIVYPPILDINHFRHFLVTLKNLYLMDDEPMWAVDRVVASTPDFAITIPKTANEFAIKGNHLTLVKGNQFDGRTKTDPHKHIHEFLEICDMFKYRDTENEVEMPRNCHGHNLSKGNIIKIFYLGLNEITQEVLKAAAGGIFLYKTPNQAYQLLEDKVLLKLDWAKNQKTKSSINKIVALADEGSSNSDTDKIIARMDAMTLKMDVQYKELQTHAKKLNPILMKMTYLCLVRKKLNSCKPFFDRLADKQSGRPSGFLPSNTQPNTKGHNSKTYQPPQARNDHVNAVFTRSGKSYNPPVNLNDQQNNSENPINFDSDDEEDEEPTPQPKTKNPKPVKETPLPKPYKLKIPYPQRLRKEKMQAQYGKFLDIICVVRINVPLIDVLAGMPNYGKVLK